MKKSGMIRAAAVAVTAGVCGAALAAPPVVSHVTMAQPQGARVAVVGYETDGAGIATFQFKTNGVDICHTETVRTVTGAINKILPAGAHSFTWDAKQDFPEQILSNLTVEVTLWATDNPPLFCAVPLAGAGTEPCWYAKASEMPACVTDSIWKTDWLLLRKIPASQGESITLGAPLDEPRSSSYVDRDLQRLVRITRPFYIGVYQVTQRQWQHVAASVANMPSYFNNPSCWEERPVEQVSYNDIRGAAPAVNWPATGYAVAQASFMGLLRARTGGVLAFDLPTESQWEYACRAGTTGAWNNGTTMRGAGNNDPNLMLLGRCQGNGGQSSAQNATLENGTAAVGSYLPNAWGLYDMHGNVFEWCLDWHEATTSGYPVLLAGGEDPAGPALSSGSRVLRGGRFGNNHTDCRSAFRYLNGPTWRSSGGGLRVAAVAEVVIAP